MAVIANADQIRRAIQADSLRAAAAIVERRAGWEPDAAEVLLEAAADLRARAAQLDVLRVGGE